MRSCLQLFLPSTALERATRLLMHFLGETKHICCEVSRGVARLSTRNIHIEMHTSEGSLPHSGLPGSWVGLSVVQVAICCLSASCDRLTKVIMEQFTLHSASHTRWFTPNVHLAGSYTADIHTLTCWRVGVWGFVCVCVCVLGLFIKSVI